jgi:hypothetical protein
LLFFSGQFFALCCYKPVTFFLLTVNDAEPTNTSLGVVVAGFVKRLKKKGGFGVFLCVL